MSKNNRRYRMIHSMQMRSTGKVHHMHTLVTPENDRERDELESFVGKGVEIVESGKPKKEDKGSTGTEDGGSDLDLQDDITELPGIGAASMQKLADLETPVTTKSGVKEFIEKHPEEAKELIGAANFAKVQKHFESEAGSDDSEGGAASSREGGETE